MPRTAPLLDLDLRKFSEIVAERSATPGGGSVAAYLAALGAGLLAMAFRFTSGPKYAGVEGAMADRVSGLDACRGRALELVDRDSASYDAVTQAYALPKASGAEKEARSRAVQTALRGALEVPLETLRAAVDALRIAEQGARDINPNLASDCATGTWCLWSAAEAAALNVRINAASLSDRDLAQSRLAECESLRSEAATLAASARSAATGRLP